MRTEAVIGIIQGSLVSIFLHFLPVTGNWDDLIQIKSFRDHFPVAPKGKYISVSSNWNISKRCLVKLFFFNLVLKLHRRLVRESGSIEKLKEERHNPGLPFFFLCFSWEYQLVASYEKVCGSRFSESFYILKKNVLNISWIMMVVGL